MLNRWRTIDLLCRGAGRFEPPRRPSTMMRSSRSPRVSPRRPTRRVAVGFSVALAVAVILTVFIDGGTPMASAQNLFGLTTTTRSGSTTTIDIAHIPVQPGRVAFVTPSGDVVVAQSDGSLPLVVGHGAVATSSGLSPLAWSP